MLAQGELLTLHAQVHHCRNPPCHGTKEKAPLEALILMQEVLCLLVGKQGGQKGSQDRHSTYLLAISGPGPSADRRKRGILAGQHPRVPLIPMLRLLVSHHLGHNCSKRKRKSDTSPWKRQEGSLQSNSHYQSCSSGSFSLRNALAGLNLSICATFGIFRAGSISSCFKKGSDRFDHQVLPPSHNRRPPRLTLQTA